MRAVGARCRSVGTDDVRTGAVRRRRAAESRVLLASRIQTVTTCRLFDTAVRTLYQQQNISECYDVRSASLPLRGR